MIKNFKKKPVIIEAVQFTGDNVDFIKAIWEELGTINGTTYEEVN